HDVRTFRQPADDLGRLGFRCVERQAALVAVQREERAALAVFGDGAGVAILTALPSIDAHNVGAHIGEQHAAVRTRDESSEVDYADSFEWKAHIWSGSRSNVSIM